MSVKIIVEIQVKEKKMELVNSLFSDLLKETRSRNGNEGVSVYSNQGTPTNIILIEQWKSRNHYEQYNKWRTERGDFIKLAEFLIQPPHRRYFDYIDV